MLTVLYFVSAWGASLVGAAVIGSGQSITLANGLLVDSTETPALETAAGNLSETNRSLISANSSLGDAMYRCSAIYGVDLNVRSCLNAVTSGLLEWRSTTVRTWGNRGSAGVDPLFTLPRRYVSGKSSSDCCEVPVYNISPGDGTCVVEPFLAPRFEIAVGSGSEVAIAAVEVAERCGGGSPSLGGVARDISKKPSLTAS